MKSLFAYLMVGGLAAGVNVLARLLFNLAVPYEAAIVLAFPVALTFAYFGNRRFVFEVTDKPNVGEYSRFALVNLVALVQVFLVSVILARFVFPAIDFNWHADTVAHVIGVLSPVLTSFFAHSKYSFKMGDQQNAKQKD